LLNMNAAAQDQVPADGRARFDEGMKLAEAGNHEAARQKFGQAWLVAKRPSVLFNLARSEQLSGHRIDALQHYRQFVKMTEPSITDAQRERAASSIADLSKKLAHLDVEPASAAVTIDGSSVTRDGIDPLPVAPGRHIVEVTADGNTARLTVDCEPGTLTKARLNADAAPPSPDPKREADLAKSAKIEPQIAKLEESAGKNPNSGVPLFQIAKLEQSVGQYASALHHHQEALRDATLPTAMRREAERAVEELKTKVGVLTLDVPPSVTTILDGSEVNPKAPLEVVPGQHKVTIRLGGEAKSVDVTAPPGAVTPVTVRFVEDPAPVAEQNPEPVAAPAPVTAEHWSGSKKVAVISGSVVAAGLMATAGIIFATADAKVAPDPSGCVDPNAPGCSDLASDRESYDSSRSASTVLFYSGAVVGVLSIAAVFLWPNDRVVVGGASKGVGSGFTVRF
jgi:hypothetical protein